jgi:hypothetical protein
MYKNYIYFVFCTVVGYNSNYRFSFFAKIAFVGEKSLHNAEDIRSSAESRCTVQETFWNFC